VTRGAKTSFYFIFERDVHHLDLPFLSVDLRPHGAFAGDLAAGASAAHVADARRLHDRVAELVPNAMVWLRRTDVDGRKLSTLFAANLLT
jgi:hypothetical protein